jgi:hypothetical protein
LKRGAGVAFAERSNLNHASGAVVQLWTSRV